MSFDMEKEYKQVSADLKQVSDDLKAYAEQSEQAVKNSTQLSAEAKAAVDELLVKQGELQGRLQAAEQALADVKTAPTTRKATSIGAQFVANEACAEGMSRLESGARGSFTIGVNAAITNVTDPDLTQNQRVPGIVAPPNQNLVIRDLLNFGTTTTNAIEYVKETGFTNNADVVSENPAAGKPESTLTFEAASAPIATIAHWVHASRQVLSDVGMLQSYIDGRLRYGLKLKEEGQLLNGSGVGLNINGIYTQATAYADPGTNVTSETAIDRLRIAMLQVTLAEYEADGIVLNPIDWTNIELTKNGQNDYILANPLGLLGPVLWGRRVVPTVSMTAGEFLTGSFGMGAQGWDREAMTVTVSTEDRDNFVKNMVTILCEERVGLTVYRPESFVKGSLPYAS